MTVQGAQYRRHRTVTPGFCLLLPLAPIGRAAYLIVEQCWARRRIAAVSLAHACESLQQIDAPKRKKIRVALRAPRNFV
jgi:hypothetical protein